jgi:hypothetical protein
VEHPAALARLRTANVWRSQTGAWGENLVEESLRLRGFDEILTIKTPHNTGIDRIAIKRNASGQIMDVLFVEVKTTRSDKLRLGVTKQSGRQMSRKWLADRLRAAYRSGDVTLKRLAQDIRRFARTSGRPLESLGEIHHVNTASGVIRRVAADGRTELSSQSIERLLSQIRRKAVSRNAREWAGRSLAGLPMIRTTAMKHWTSAGPIQVASVRQTRAFTHVTIRRANLANTARGGATRRILSKSAGRAAVALAVALDAKELYDTEHAYWAGDLSRRDRNIRHFATGGGIAGAWAGASLGASREGRSEPSAAPWRR